MISNITVDKSKDKIEAMFDEIAPTYDRLNHMFTLNTDKKWRKDIVKYLTSKNIPKECILDIASGTGDLTAELVRLNPEKIYAVDISKNMLEIQRKKIKYEKLELIRADVSDLPFEDNFFDVITIGFGIRNFHDLRKSLKEIKRVLKNGGILIILEMFRSDNFRTKLFNLYFGKLMPYIGNKISKSRYAYEYLFRSVDSFLSVKDFIKDCDEEGYKMQLSKNNFLGIVNTVYLTKEL